MNDTARDTAVVGVVLQLYGTSPIDGHFADVPGSPTGSLQLGSLDGSGVTVVFGCSDVLERTLDELRYLLHGFAQADRRAQEEAAWVEHDLARPRPWADDERPELTDAGLAVVTPLRLVPVQR